MFLPVGPLGTKCAACASQPSLHLSDGASETTSLAFSRPPLIPQARVFNKLILVMSND